MFISLDLETTGFSSEKDKIIEFGAVKFDLKGKKETLQFFINPGITLPQIITHITNITDKDLQNAPTFQEKFEEIENFIGDLPIIGHNIQFDTSFLKINGLQITNSQYDTQELAGILLPNMPSYSLEILTDALNLKHKEKHRALDDAIATMELLLALVKKFQALPPDLIKKIHALCEKSNWPLKDLILTLKPLKKRDIKPETGSLTQQTIQTKESKKSNYKKILNTDAPALFEEPSRLEELIKDLISEASKETYVAIPHFLFRQIHNQIPDNVAKIDTPSAYISLKRLEEFEKKNYFQNFELTALLKYLVWLPQTKTGLLSEVKLFKEEKTVLQQINIDENTQNPEEEIFFKKALEKDKNAAALCSHNYLIEAPLENIDLIILDLENFVKSLHWHSSSYLKLDSLSNILNLLQKIFPENKTIEKLKSSAVFLFGILGIIFEKTNDRNNFCARAHIENATLNTKEWLDAKDLINKLIEISKELGEINNEKTYGFLQAWKKILKELEGIFRTQDLSKIMIWLEQNQYEELILRKIPSEIGNAMQEILKKCKTYKIIDENIDLLDDAEFIKKISGLDPKIPFYKHTKKLENIEINIVKNINDADKHQVVNFLEKYLKNTKEKSAIILNSHLQLEFFTLELSKKNIPTISQLTASIGKLQEQFKQTHNPILITPNIWFNFESASDIDTLFIHKIPFDPPSDPFLVALSQNFDDPFNELQVPRAVLSIKRMIKPLGTTETPKKVIIFDSRLITKEYGQQFIKNLNDIAVTKIISI